MPGPVKAAWVLSPVQCSAGSQSQLQRCLLLLLPTPAAPHKAEIPARPSLEIGPRVKYLPLLNAYSISDHPKYLALNVQ